MASKLLCSIAECFKTVTAKGLCRAHYSRMRRYGDPASGRIPHGEAKRYFQEVVLSFEKDECLTWPYGRDSSGYGRLWTETGAQNVSRLVCEEQFGPVGAHQDVAAHRCGKGHEGCVAKAHVYWASHAQNAADRQSHGTTYRGGNMPAL